MSILVLSFKTSLGLYSCLGHILHCSRRVQVMRLHYSSTGYGAWQHSLELLVNTPVSPQGDPRLKIPYRSPQGQNTLSHPWQLSSRLHHTHTNKCPVSTITFHLLGGLYTFFFILGSFFRHISSLSLDTFLKDIFFYLSPQPP